MKGICRPWGTSLAHHRTWWRTSPVQLYLHVRVSLSSVSVILIHYLYMGFQRRLFSHSLPTIIATHIAYAVLVSKSQKMHTCVVVSSTCTAWLILLTLSICFLKQYNSLVDDEYKLGILVSLVFKVQWLLWRRNRSLEYCLDKLERRQIHSPDFIETLHETLMTTNTVGENGACLCVQYQRLGVKSVLLYIWHVICVTGNTDYQLSSLHVKALSRGLVFCLPWCWVAVSVNVVSVATDRFDMGFVFLGFPSCL